MQRHDEKQVVARFKGAAFGAKMRCLSGALVEQYDRKDPRMSFYYITPHDQSKSQVSSSDLDSFLLYSLHCESFL